MMTCTRMLKLLLLVAAAGGTVWATSTERKPLEPDDNQRRISKVLADTLPRMHLSREAVGDAQAISALDVYLESLDFDHIFFLASDIDEFKREGSTLDDRLKRGEIDPGFDIYERFVQRVSNRVQFAEQFLKTAPATNSQERYVWKRKKEPWPKDEAAWNALWRQRLTHEYVGRLVSRELARADKAASTNQSATATNGTVKAKDSGLSAETLAELNQSPEEAILKSYKRYLTILYDNDANFVVERYLNAFTEAYDPHSNYMSPDDAENFDIGMRLSLFGIGALLTSEDGAAKVERLIPGGPAAKGGELKVGDKIIAVAQGNNPPEDILHLPLSKAVRKIRGEKGSTVILTVIPATDPTGSTVEKIKIVRDEVKLEEQAAKGEVKDMPDGKGGTRKLGIIRLPEFYADMKSGRSDARSAAKDVIRILKELKSKNVEGILLDLRNNGGGSLAEAITMSGAFIESGPVVQVKEQGAPRIFSDPDPSATYTGPLAVLVNRMSASASEILAAALQDYGRALIIGDSKTHGKGTVQTLAELGERWRLLMSATNRMGSVKLTTASFYRIAGGSTQLNGVKPDIVIPSALDAMEIGEEYLPNALKWTEVYQAFYEPVENLAPLIPRLNEASQKRRLTDPSFATYEELVKRVADRQKMTDITLNYADRLALARSERELEKQLKDREPVSSTTEADPEDGKEAEKSPDPVLAESLRILSDFIAIESEGKAQVTRTGPT